MAATLLPPSSAPTRFPSLRLTTLISSRKFSKTTTCINCSAAQASPPMDDRQHSKKHVAVCGGGIIGVCTAYFLATKGATVTLIEKSSGACAASGKAGGFLALDWCDGGPLSSLARASFNLYRSLAVELNGPDNYGYRALTTLTVTESQQTCSKPSNKANSMFRRCSSNITIVMNEIDAALK